MYNITLQYRHQPVKDHDIAFPNMYNLPYQLIKNISRKLNMGSFIWLFIQIFRAGNNMYLSSNAHCILYAYRDLYLYPNFGCSRGCPNKTIFLCIRTCPFYKYTPISVPLLKTMVTMFWWPVAWSFIHGVAAGLCFLWDMLLSSPIWSKFNHLGPPIRLSIDDSLYRKVC